MFLENNTSDEKISRPILHIPLGIETWPMVIRKKQDILKFVGLYFEVPIVSHFRQ